MNPEPLTGYCLNVHPVSDLESLIANLGNFAGPVRRAVNEKREMGCGLWFPQQVITHAAANQIGPAVREALEREGLRCTTLNAFPQLDFHQPAVKKLVYEPNWATRQRLDFSESCASLLAEIIPDDVTTGSISTLPLGWSRRNDRDFQQHCAERMIQWARHATELEQVSGKRIRLAIEPEPGCCFDRGWHVIEFFDKYLRPAAAKAGLPIESFIGVCHDICHAAVMFESQRDVLELYSKNSVGIFKVQVSAALQANFKPGSVEETLASLKRFHEPQFLHQTNVNGIQLFDDLSLALQHGAEAGDQWRVHFHVPVFVQQIFPGLVSTQTQIVECFKNHELFSDADIEIETYAWNCLPGELRESGLIDGIAKEIRWFESTILEPPGAVQ